MTNETVEAVALERAVMVCPQCEGEGSYADGLDEAACTTECTRCGSNGWIVDLAALTAIPTQLGEVIQADDGDLRELYERILSGTFYDDYDEASRLTGVLRRHVESLEDHRLAPQPIPVASPGYEVDKLREALKPFADLADFLDEQPDPRWQNPHDEFQCGDFPYSIGVGQLHAARNAYRAIKPGYEAGLAEWRREVEQQLVELPPEVYDCIAQAELLATNHGGWFDRNGFKALRGLHENCRKVLERYSRGDYRPTTSGENGNVG